MNLQVTERTLKGKKVKLLRQEGLVPAIVYWKAMKEPKMITFLKNDFLKINRKIGLSMPIELAGWSKETVIVKSYFVDPVTDELQHVDFLAVSKWQIVQTDVPLVFVGEAPVDKLGLGKTQHVKDFLHIEAKPGDIPQQIEVDVSGLETANDGIFVSDIKLPKGVVVLDDPELSIVTVSSLSWEEPDAEEELSIADAAAEIAEWAWDTAPTE